MRGLLLTWLALIALGGGAKAADVSASMPTKAPPQTAPVAYDWTGFYAGVHYGYAAGSSHWSATQSGAATPLSGSLDMLNAYDPFTATGGYLHGFQAGYNYVLPSHVVVGAEADISFPSLLGGHFDILLAIERHGGLEKYSEAVEFSGTLRARIGYSTGNWLFYATGGFAYSYDQLTRTQLSATGERHGRHPFRGAALRRGGRRRRRSSRCRRNGWRGWNFSIPTMAAYRRFSRMRPSGFTSNLDVAHATRRPDYKLGQTGVDAESAQQGPRRSISVFAVPRRNHFHRAGLVPPFHAPYQGANSLHFANQGRDGGDASLYAGFRLWQGAELWIDAEIDQGFGVSNTDGVAGFRTARPKGRRCVPYARLPRYFVRQTIDLGGKSQKVDGAANQFAGSQTENRIVFTVGKVCRYRYLRQEQICALIRATTFLNWALVDTGTFDYAADAWGYSYGAAAEWYQGDWTVRGGLFDLVHRSEQCRTRSEFRTIPMAG